MEVDWLKKWAHYSPNKIAIKDADTGRSFNYGQLLEHSNRLAWTLKERYHLEKGDRVCILSQNQIEYVFLFFALNRLGAIMVPINFRLTPREISHIIKDSDPGLLIYHEQYLGIVAELDNLTSSLRTTSLNEVETVLKDHTLSYEPLPGNCDFDDLCMILYTSGTTGSPKGAMITYGMIFWNSVNTTLRLNLSQNDITVGFSPFFHTGAWNVLTLPLLHRGGTVIFLSKFEAERVLRVCEQEHVTIFFGVPTTLDMMSREAFFNSVNLGSVRYAVVGGEAMPRDLILKWEAKGIPVRQGYGLTEFGPNVFSLNEEDSIKKIGSIGFPNFYIDTKLLDGSGREIPGEGEGELVLKGPMCTPGYWKNPEETKKAIRDSWFHTGDIARRDNDNYFYIVGRKKDMFISGGENVYPAEIEQVLVTFPQVREAAVIGVKDDKWGEVGKAFLRLENGVKCNEEELAAFCRKNLAKYKIPKHFVFLDALPRGENGKILKSKLAVFKS